MAALHRNENDLTKFVSAKVLICNIYPINTVTLIRAEIETGRIA